MIVAVSPSLSSGRAERNKPSMGTSNYSQAHSQTQRWTSRRSSLSKETAQTNGAQYPTPPTGWVDGAVCVPQTLVSLDTDYVLCYYGEHNVTVAAASPVDLSVRAYLALGHHVSRVPLSFNAGRHPETERFVRDTSSQASTRNEQWYAVFSALGTLNTSSDYRLFLRVYNVGATRVWPSPTRLALVAPSAYSTIKYAVWSWAHEGGAAT